MGPIGIAHVSVALLALLTGAAIFLIPQGTTLHRRLGYAYVVCMLGVNGTAFGLYRLLGTFGPFHVVALISLFTTARGLIPVIRRQPGWLYQHYYWISFSYVGLMAAFATEIAVRVPLFRTSLASFIAAIVIPTLIVTAVGWVLVERNMKRLLGRIAVRAREHKIRAAGQMGISTAEHAEGAERERF